MTASQRIEARGTHFGLRAVLIATIVIVGIGSIHWVLRDAEFTESLPAEEVESAARTVSDFIQPTIESTIELARLVERAKAAGSGRDIIRGLAIPTLQQSLENVGVAVVFEPNGFDGKDASFAAEGPEYDNHGRFVPYYDKLNDGPVETQSLTMTEEAGIEEWYLKPLHSQRTRLMTPYIYPIEGIDELLTTVSVPMVADGKAFGVTALDIRLTELTKAVRALKPGGNGVAAVLSDTGSWIVHPDLRRIGQDVLQTHTESTGPFDDDNVASAYAGYVAGNRSGLYADQRDAAGAQYVMVPVTFTSVPERWTLVLRLPPPGMTKQLAQALLISLAILLVVALCMAVLMVTSESGVPRPHRKSKTSLLTAGSQRKQPTIERR